MTEINLMNLILRKAHQFSSLIYTRCDDSGCASQLNTFKLWRTELDGGSQTFIKRKEYPLPLNLARLDKSGDDDFNDTNFNFTRLRRPLSGDGGRWCVGLPAAMF